MGNGDAKELICMTHGHELRGRITGGKAVLGRRGERRKNWGNCNSMINNIYFFKKKERIKQNELEKNLL